MFSHSLHSYGLSTTYAGNATPAGYVNLLFLAIETSLIFAAHSAIQYQSIRGRAIGAMKKTVRDTLKEILSLNHFNEWISSLKQEDESFGIL